MLIKIVVIEEQKRNAQMIDEYQKAIEALPKGSLSLKNGYYYLKYRSNKKVITDYIGKDAVKVANVEKQINKRKHYEELLTALNKEHKAILKMLEVLK